MSTTDWRAARSQFPTLQAKNYLNSCSLGLLSRRARAAAVSYLDLWEEKGAAAWYDEWMAELDELRRAFARIINARPEEVAVMPSISAALAAVVSSLDLHEGDQVVTSELDFPTIAHHFHAWERTGVEATVIRSEDRVLVRPDQFEDATSNRTRLLATSHVYFTSGYIQDVKAICDIAHRRGALAFVDDYQATGQVPIDVRETGADILVSGGLKWLLGGPGIAYMYVREELIRDLEPTVSGWFGNRDQFLFNPHDMIFRDTAARFETGTPSIAAVYTGAEGLRMVNQLGPASIRQRTSDLTFQLVASLREHGFTLRAPKDETHHASITMIELDEPEAIVESLARQDIIVDYRPGAVRVSPYFYNTADEIGSLVASLVEIQSTRS